MDEEDAEERETGSRQDDKEKTACSAMDILA
jgi:hypothetical protein